MFLFYLLVVLAQTYASQTVYITATQSCGTSCTGSTSSPYDNLLIALSNHQNQDDIIFKLLKDSNPHYLMTQEYQSGSTTTFSYTGISTALTLGRITIQPLFCTDSDVASFTTQCAGPTDQITVNMKTTGIVLTMTKDFAIKNVIFDAADDVNHFQIGSPTDTCQSKRVACCANSQASAATSIICKSISFTFQMATSPSDSIFWVSPVSASLVTITIDQSKFLNFHSIYSKSLVGLPSSQYTLTITNSEFSKIMFFYGIIYHGTASTGSGSSINLSNTKLSMYNDWNLVLGTSPSSHPEGILLMASEDYYGNITIDSSSFDTSTTSLRSYCKNLSLGSTDFVRPNNYYQTTQPYSRSDLWSYYHADHKGKDHASLINIAGFKGTMTVKNSQFKKIIGTSGSIVKVIDKNTAAADSYLFDSNIFDSNFAYDGFANILIVKESFSQLSDAKLCPQVTIINDSFTNTGGCPGAYGNVMILCYLDKSPSLLFDNDYSSESPSLVNSLLNLDNSVSTGLAPIIVKDSTFMNNYLSVSNSLAIIGSPYVYLSNLIFTHNGGIPNTGYIITLSTFYFYTRNIERIGNLSTEYFAQSTSLYLEHVFKLDVFDCTFSRNWGPFSGSLALGSSITIKNALLLQNNYHFERMTITLNFGMPFENNLYLYFSKFTPPIFTMSNNRKAQNLFVVANVPFSNYVMFKNSTISSNMLSFDLSYFTIESEIIYLKELFKSKIRMRSGIFKFLNSYESADDINKAFTTDDPPPLTPYLIITDSQLTGNILITSGCMFANHFFGTVVLNSLNITQNQIGMMGEFYYQYSNIRYPDLQHIPSDASGMFCLANQETNYFPPGQSQLLQVFNSYFGFNQGILIHTSKQIPTTFMMEHSYFFNNTCKNSSMINLYGGNVAIIDVQFVLNFNALGAYFAQGVDIILNNNNDYLKNNGYHASNFFLYNNKGGFYQEQGARFVFSQVSPANIVAMGLLSPLASPFFMMSSQMTIFFSEFKYNYMVTGLVISKESTLNFINVGIFENYVNGSALIGHFFDSSSLVITNSIISNNKFDANYLTIKKACIILYFSDLTMSKTLVSNLQLNEEGFFLYAVTSFISIENSSFTSITKNFNTHPETIWALYSTIYLVYLTLTGCSSPFNFVSASVVTDHLRVYQLLPSMDHLFIIRVSDTHLINVGFSFLRSLNEPEAKFVKYVSGELSDVSFYLSDIFNPATSSGSFFDLRSSKFTLYSAIVQQEIEKPQFTFIKLQDSEYASVIFALLINVGNVLTAENIYKSLIFTSCMITSQGISTTLKLIETNMTVVTKNYWLVTKNTVNSYDLPDSQILFQDLTGPLFFQFNIMMGMKGQNGIVKIDSTKYPFEINFIDNIFVLSSANYGGVLHVRTVKGWSISKNPKLIMDSTTFFKNNAEYYGGAIYVTSPDQTLTEISITNSNFYCNSAGLSGGAIYFDYSPPIFGTGVVFNNNTAVVPNNIGSYPIQLALIHPSLKIESNYDPNKPVISNQFSTDISSLWSPMTPGVTSSKTYLFALLDVYNQITYYDSFSTIEVYPQGFSLFNRSKFTSSFSIQASSGIYKFEDFSFTYQGGQRLLVNFTSNGVVRFPLPPTANRSTPMYSVIANITFKKCGPGEYVSDTGACSTCKAQFWYVTLEENGNGPCTQCDANAICNGGNKVGPRPGYWRMNETANLVIACPNPLACIGNDPELFPAPSTPDPIGNCSESYIGNLCANCDEGYAAYGSDFQCVNCRENGLYYLKLFGSIILKIILLFISINETMNLSQKYSKKEDFQETNKTVLMKVLFNYTTMIGIVHEMTIPWPDFLARLTSFNSSMSNTNTDVFSFDCFFAFNKSALTARVFYLKSLVTAMTPYFIGLLGLIGTTLYFFIKKKPIKGSKDYKFKIITMMVIIGFNFQPIIIKQMLYFYQCKNLYRTDNPVYFLTQDYDQNCANKSHFLWTMGLSLTNLILWGIYLPLMIFIRLNRQRNQLENEDVAKKYAFIYLGYKKESFYFEFIILLRKYFLIAVVVFGGLYSTSMQIYFSTVLVLISSVAQAQILPFENPEMNKVELLSLTSSGIVNFTALYFQSVGTVNGLSVVILIIGFLANMAFLVRWVGLFVVMKLCALKEKKEKIYNIGKKMILTVHLASKRDFEVMENPVKTNTENKNEESPDHKKLKIPADHETEPLAQNIKYKNEEELTGRDIDKPSKKEKISQDYIGNNPKKEKDSINKDLQIKKHENSREGGETGRGMTTSKEEIPAYTGDIDKSIEAIKEESEIVRLQSKQPSIVEINLEEVGMREFNSSIDNLQSQLGKDFKQNNFTNVKRIIISASPSINELNNESNS